MDTNPYAPPKAPVADRPDATTGLKRISVLVMIVLTFVTLGVYNIVWYFRRRTALNQLDSPRKLPLWPMCAHVTMLAVTLVVDAMSLPGSSTEAVDEDGALILRIALLATSILMIVMTFRIKGMLEDHLAGQRDASQMFADEPVTLSGLLTFFFSIFYLQYAINRHIIDAPARVA